MIVSNEAFVEMFHEDIKGCKRVEYNRDKTFVCFHQVDRINEYSTDFINDIYLELLTLQSSNKLSHLNGIVLNTLMHTGVVGKSQKRGESKG